MERTCLNARFPNRFLVAAKAVGAKGFKAVWTEIRGIPMGANAERHCIERDGFQGLYSIENFQLEIWLETVTCLKAQILNIFFSVGNTRSMVNRGHLIWATFGVICFLAIK